MKGIVPSLWFDGQAEDRAKRAMEAMLKMSKLEVDVLEKAAAGG